VVGSQVEPAIKAPLIHSARIVKPGGYNVPVKSTPTGLRTAELTLRTISAPFIGLLLLRTTRTLIAVGGPVVTGPVSAGAPLRGHALGALNSGRSGAIHTLPPVKA